MPNINIPYYGKRICIPFPKSKKLSATFQTCASTLNKGSVFWHIDAMLPRMLPSAVTNLKGCVNHCVCARVCVEAAERWILQRNTSWLLNLSSLLVTETVKASGLSGAGACWDAVVCACASVGSFVTVWVSKLFLSLSQNLIYSAVHIHMPIANWGEI